MDIKNKINKEQLESTLSEAIIRKDNQGQYNLNIRLDSDFEFYFNFDSFYNEDDIDFIYTITKDFEKLQAIDKNGEYIEDEVDMEYLQNEVEYYTNDIMEELQNINL